MKYLYRSRSYLAQKHVIIIYTYHSFNNKTRWSLIHVSTCVDHFQVSYNVISTVHNEKHYVVGNPKMTYSGRNMLY
jgi:hypothetical protein